jgi:UDP-N-acetylglucosamine 2-epimerase (non-hydrolysing)
VEAGLRTSTLREPFPEELNRRLISRMAVLHFAPTAHAMANLQEESVVGGHLTGNPVVDELQAMLAAPLWPGDDLAPGEGVVVVTCHRRESWDSRLPLLVLALAELADANPKWRIVWPLHPNPLIERVARPTLDRLLHPNVTLLSALPYRQFIRLLQHAELVITDSGGVIEEAATMGRRLLIIRDETERPEAIASGRARLVPRGSTAELPALAAEMIATVPDLPWSTLFGDGKAGPRIADLLVEWVEAHERG